MDGKKESILIEILQNQVSCSREEARHLLKKYNYHLVSAVNELKNKCKQNDKHVEETIQVAGKHLLSTVKNLLKKSNAVHITIMKNERTLLSIPLTVTMIVTYLYPLLSSLGFIYFLNKEYTIKILKTIDQY